MVRGLPTGRTAERGFELLEIVLPEVRNRRAQHADGWERKAIAGCGSAKIPGPAGTDVDEHRAAARQARIRAINAVS